MFRAVVLIGGKWLPVPYTLSPDPDWVQAACEDLSFEFPELIFSVRVI